MRIHLPCIKNYILNFFMVKMCTYNNQMLINQNKLCLESYKSFGNH